jgi:hypothetical protein
MSAQCADWIAEQLTEEYGGFIAAEAIDAMLEFEEAIREQRGDPLMSHPEMAEALIAKLAEEGAPVNVYGGINTQMLIEVLHLEDEFRANWGAPRHVR